MIRDMKDRGMSNREIARDLGISRNTVSKLLRTTRLTDHGKKITVCVCDSISLNRLPIHDGSNVP